tara:strand:- start:56 stop:391 length:336 start_codon:yes stop_codon:yes gene_type:complete
MSKTQLKKIIREYIADTLNKHGVQRRGYIMEYQLWEIADDGNLANRTYIPKRCYNSPELWKLDALVEDMIEMKEGYWDYWKSLIDQSDLAGTFCFPNSVMFNVDEIVRDYR